LRSNTNGYGGKTHLDWLTK